MITIAIFATALLCLAIAAVVFFANPQRFPNFAFALGALVVAVWLFFVFGAVRAEHALALGRRQNLIFWLRANTMIIALWPWTIWLMRQSLLMPDRQRWATVVRSWPWLVIAAIGAALSLDDRFAWIDANSVVHRGWPYAAYIAILCCADTFFVVQTWRLMRRLEGIRRLEVRFLALNLGYGGLIGATLLFLGNVLHIQQIKWVGLIFFAAPYALSTWAVTVYRVFDARQIFFSFGHRVGLVALGGSAILLLEPLLERVLPAGESLFVAASTCCVLLLWLDHKSRMWLGLDGRHALQRLRRAVIELSRTTASTADLIAAFEELLRKECQADFAALIPSASQARPQHDLPFEHPGSEALRQIGWATPETLHRRRGDPGRRELLRFLDERALGLLLAVPRGSPTPSLIVAIGTKTNRGPFTYPEVERLISVGELMDNIVARSRVTTQAALQMMSRGLAHDLNSLITPISSFLVHIDGQFPQGSPQADVHAHAFHSVKVMQDYIRDAMYFGKDLTPKKQQVPLKTALATVRDLTAPRAAQRGVAVVVPADCPLALFADPLLLQRLLTNLVNNAIDASERGQAATLTAALSEVGTMRLTITDKGCGIAPENLSRVFEPYFTTKQYGDEVRGFGLGLSICRKIVDLHGGTIRIESELRRGTAVIVDLPIVPPTEEHSNTPSAPGAHIGTAKCPTVVSARPKSQTEAGLYRC